MRGLEGLLASSGFGRIAGVDEVGRGALAGPVVVAAVVMPADCLLPCIDDSKNLEPELRSALAGLVRRHALAVEVRAVASREIDKGYGAEEHRLALERFGPCPEHRLTFGSVVPTRRAGAR
jgi:ribonuclease HII